MAISGKKWQGELHGCEPWAVAAGFSLRLKPGKLQAKACGYGLRSMLQMPWVVQSPSLESNYLDAVKAINHLEGILDGKYERCGSRVSLAAHFGGDRSRGSADLSLARADAGHDKHRRGEPGQIA